MKKLIFAFLILSTTLVHADTKKDSKKALKSAATKNALTPEIGTDFKFDGMTVRGQYQSANEGLVTVENEKQLTDLLDYRTDYKDRLANSRLNP